MLNVAEDHLDWHGSMAAYAAGQGPRAGRRGSRSPGVDDPVAAGLLRHRRRPRAGRVSAGRARRPASSASSTACSSTTRSATGWRWRTAASIPVAGPDRDVLTNALAAAALARAVGVPPDAIARGARRVSRRAAPCRRGRDRTTG